MTSRIERTSEAPDEGRHRSRRAWLLVLGVAVLVAVVAGLISRTPRDGPVGEVVLPTDLPRPSAGADDRDGASPTTIEPCSSTARSLDAPCTRWTLALAAGERPSDRVRVIRSGDVVIAAGDGTVQRRDRETGASRWGTERLGEVRLGAVGHGTVALVVDDRDLVLLDVGSGRRLWARDVGSDHEPLAGHDTIVRRVRMTRDAVYAVVGSELVALDRAGGEERWTWSAQHVLSADVAGGQPYVVPVDGVVGLGAATGEQRWRVPMVTFDHRVHRVLDGRLLVADAEGLLTAVLPDSGRTLWQWEPTDPARVYDVFPADGDLVADTDGSRFVVLDQRTGEVLRKSLGENDADVGRDVLAVGEGMVVQRGVRPHQVFGVAVATGAVRWRHDLSAPARAAAIAEDEVRLTTDEGVLGLNTRTGRLRWAGRLHGDPTLVTATPPLLVATEDALHAVVPPG